jgi:O-antigen biosynthesis protein
MEMSAALPPASIVIVSYNSAAFLPACIESVLAQDFPDVEIIVVDNASADGSADAAGRFPAVRLIRSDRNLGFAGGANAGLRAAKGQILCVLNPDVMLRQDWLREITSALLRDEKAGIAGSKLLYPDGKTIQHAGGEIQRPEAVTGHTGYGETDQGQYDEVRECDFVTGAALAAKRDVLEQIGYFDESFYPAYFEEPDLCLRAKQAGYKTVYVPSAVAIHHESATLSMRSEEYFRLHHANRLRFVAKHWGTEELFDGFLPGETARLRGTIPEADRNGSVRAYRVVLEEMEQSGDMTVTPDGRSRNAGELYRQLDSLQKQVDILRARWLVQEQPFRSGAPFVGRFVIYLRSRFNNLSTRWYVQPILQQQNEFNQAAYRALEDVERQIENLDAPMVMHNAIVYERLSRLEKTTNDRLDAVDERLARIEAAIQAMQEGKQEM